MKLSKAIEEVEVWLGDATYDFEITSAEVKAEGEIRVNYSEYMPSGEDSCEDFLTVMPDGTIINSNGDDVVDVAQEAYSDDPDIIDWLQRFVDEYYDESQPEVTEYFCKNCQLTFAADDITSEDEDGNDLCPACGSTNFEEV